MSWQSVTAEVLLKVTAKKVVAIAAANAAVMLQNRPSKVIRKVDGDPNATDDAIKLVSKVVYQYVYLTEIVAVALRLLREKSPVGSKDDKHAGLYRDSHFVFLNGTKVDDVAGWQPGQVIYISNPVPYARKIESGRMKTSVPGHVYEGAAQVLAPLFSNVASIEYKIVSIDGALQPALEIKAR